MFFSFLTWRVYRISSLAIGLFFSPFFFHIFLSVSPLSIFNPSKKAFLFTFFHLLRRRHFTTVCWHMMLPRVFVWGGVVGGYGGMGIGGGGWWGAFWAGYLFGVSGGIEGRKGSRANRLEDKQKKGWFHFIFFLSLYLHLFPWYGFHIIGHSSFLSNLWLDKVLSFFFFFFFFYTSWFVDDNLLTSYWCTWGWLRTGLLCVDVISMRMHNKLVFCISMF
ncbi:hypothetical protein K440DRAFT_44752 [Wilcoxina mikolae CBS 423.85]|nr:hypothetical protein K440DRAFT_44752 [Wilcoxina mikolae CBS 423.85]